MHSQLLPQLLEATPCNEILDLHALARAPGRVDTDDQSAHGNDSCIPRASQKVKGLQGDGEWGIVAHEAIARQGRL